MPKTTTKPDDTELTADDIALWSAVIVIIGDLVGLYALLKERTEKD